MNGTGRALLLTAITALAACGRGEPRTQAAPAPRVTSVMAVQDGRVVVEEYYGGAGAATRHDPRSAMKTVTALAVGMAIERGLIDSVDAPAFDLLGDLAPFAHDGPLKRGITIADLLTMSSALDCNDSIPASPGNEENMYPRRRWARWAVDLPVDASWSRDAAGRGRYAYCTAGTFLLGQILERVSGTSVDRWIEEQLLAPIGITDVEWSRSPTGEVMTGGGLRMRSRDLARLGELVLARGRWQGAQVVPAAWIDAMTTKHRAPDEHQDPERVLDYGYQMWRRDYRTPCGTRSGWYMSGNGGNHVVVLRDLDAVVVVTSVNYNTRGMHANTVEVVEKHALPRLACR